MSPGPGELAVCRLQLAVRSSQLTVAVHSLPATRASHTRPIFPISRSRTLGKTAGGEPQTANGKLPTANRSSLAPFPNSWKIAAQEIITEGKTDAFWFDENHEA